jgi:hypothetical protein
MVWMIKGMIKGHPTQDGKASCFLDGSKSRLGGLPHGGSRVRPSVPTDGSGCQRATSPGGPGESGRGGLLRSLAPSSEDHDQHQPKGRPGCRGRQADPVSSLSRKAQAKPTAVASATQRPPCSKASGNIVSANKARIPPAARARMALTQPGDRPASRA